MGCFAVKTAKRRNMKSKFKVLVIVLLILVALVVGMVVAGGLWLKNYRETKFADVDFIIPEGGVTEMIQEYENYPPPAAPEAVVAEIGDTALTNAELQVYFWAQVAAHAQTDEVQPDLRVPLKWQACPLEGAENWEEYFLLKAVNTWHTAQALVMQGDAEGLPLEERYQPNLDWHAEYMTGNEPAIEFLYGWNPGYRVNTLHQKYIDALPELLDELANELDYPSSEDMTMGVFGTTEEAVLNVASLYNRGYSYYTALTYLLGTEFDTTVEKTEEAEAPEVTVTPVPTPTATPAPAYDGTPCISFRQILVRPEHPQWYSKQQAAREPQVEYNVAPDGKVSCVESGWRNADWEAQSLLSEWRSDYQGLENGFGQLAYERSDDEASKKHGGYYVNVLPGEVPAELEEWLFDPVRKHGDTKVIRSEYGFHVLYFSEGTTVEAKAEADEAMTVKQEKLLAIAKERFPMELHLEAAAVQPGASAVTMDDLLYADIGHERFPEVPVYLQRDYGDTMYGAYKLWSHGCGITSMAMLSTYLTDEEWTPPELCDMFGSYCGLHGTDTSLFWRANHKLGFFYERYVYDDDEAYQALEDGYLVVAQELKGYWTGGGHYIVLEKLTEDGKVVVRDSNILNYIKLEGHGVDYFDWELITPEAVIYFIMGKKAVTVDACCRCGNPTQQSEAQVGADYICHKCDDAMLRRSTFLANT